MTSIFDKHQSQGALANYSGTQFEKKIEQIVNDAGFEVVSYQEWILSGRNDHVLVSRVPYTRLGGSKGFLEYVLVIDGERIRLECRSQTSSGSVDEKYDNVIRTALTSKDHPHFTLIIHAGTGARQTMIEELKDFAFKASFCSPDRNVSVLSEEEFVSWLKEVSQYV
jgi:hypothetical protein